MALAGGVRYFFAGVFFILVLEAIVYQWHDVARNYVYISSIEPIMRLSVVSSNLTLFASLSASTILQNGQVRETHFLNTKIDPIGTNSTGWRTYGANATEISYKGRWDSKHISWWAYVHFWCRFVNQSTLPNLRSHCIEFQHAQIRYSQWQGPKPHVYHANMSTIMVFS
jgi:hypothetical protein